MLEVAKLKTKDDYSKSVALSIKAVLDLPDDVLKRINEWAISNKVTLPSSLLSLDLDTVGRAADECGVSTQDFGGAVGVLLTVARALADTSLEEYTQELKQYDIPLELAASKLHILVDGIQLTEEQFQDSIRAISYSSLAIPTMSDFDIVFDLRAAFRHYPSPEDSEEHKKALTEIVQWIPVAIISFELEDEAGHKSASVFQMRAPQFLALVKAFEDGKSQLQVLQAVKSQLDNS